MLSLIFLLFKSLVWALDQGVLSVLRMFFAKLFQLDRNIIITNELDYLPSFSVFLFICF